MYITQMQNVEIKARYIDLDKARAIAQKLGASFAGQDHQVDTYFKTAKGRFKLRQSSLKGKAELIPYLRADLSGPKKSDYLLIEVSDPTVLQGLLSEILGLDVIVEKTRDIFLLENVRIHLDEVKGLGRFFEFEAVYENLSDEKAEAKKVENLIKQFEIAEDDLIKGSYRELLAAVTNVGGRVR